MECSGHLLAEWTRRREVKPGPKKGDLASKLSFLENIFKDFVFYFVSSQNQQEGSEV